MGVGGGQGKMGNGGRRRKVDRRPLSNSTHNPVLPVDLTLLAIESSCDDTAAAVLTGGRVASSVVAS